jgi:uncharacterized protein YlxW (UPF0749 family)
MRRIRLAGRGRPDPNPAASMALLQEVLDRPLDPGYASAAEDRRSQGLDPSTGGRTVLLGVSSVLIGFLLTIAVAELRAPDPDASAARAELVERIRELEAVGDELATSIEVQREEVAALEGEAVGGGSTSDPQVERLRDAGQAAGATALVGPGVRVVMDDAPVGDAGGDPGTVPTDSRVLARDLQVVVNGLWGHGAEAVAVNGQRLTATSAIRFAGEAIVVDFRGLTRPYEVVAVGDTAAMTAELGEGETGRYLAELTDDYGVQAQVVTEEELTVPAGSRLSTRLARVGAEEEDEG